MTLGEYLGAGSGITKGLYHLNGDANDSSGNVYNGTAYNITYSNGKIGNGSASFNRSNGYIDITADAFQSMTSWTLSLWFNTNDTTNGKNLIRFEQKFIIQASQSPFNIVTYMKDSGGTLRTIQSGKAYSANTRYNIIITHSGTTTKTYLNTNLIGTLEGYSTNTGAKGVQYIGREASGYYYGGLIDEVIIENKAWTPEQIKKYYTYSLGRFIQ